MKGYKCVCVFTSAFGTDPIQKQKFPIQKKIKICTVVYDSVMFLNVAFNVTH